MSNANNNNTLVLIGGTGGLGSLVAKGLINAEGFSEKKALVRDVAKGKVLEEMGWTVVEVSNFTDSALLEEALGGAKVVVSTLSGGDMVGIEMAIVSAAKAVGVSLFVPSQFGVDYRRWGTAFPFLAGKKVVLDHADKEGLSTLKVFTGFFSDANFSFFFDIENGTGSIVGDGSVKVSFTNRADIGTVLAKALSDEKYANGGFLSMEGDHKTFKEAIELLEQATGKKFTIETIDPQEALQQEQELLKAGLQGDMGAFYGSFKLHLLGEPARGNDGCDISAEAESYGVKLATLEETLMSVYGAK